MSNHKKFAKALRAVEALIAKLQRAAVTDLSLAGRPQSMVLFSRGGRGLQLTDETASEYRNVLRSLQRPVCSTGTISPRLVEDVLQEALVEGR